MDVTETTGSAKRLVLQSGLTHTARQHLAATDARGGLGLWRLAMTLGWFDIRLRYRGSLLGPFWLTLSTGVMIAALGVLYSRLFKMELHDYLPFLALSLVLWGFVGTVIGDACLCFTGAEGMIRSMRMPYFLYAFRVVVRNVLILAHNLPVILCVYAWFDIWPGMALFGVVPATLLWIVDGVACCLLLGSVCARFRDIPPIVGSVMQIAFFVSPIIWKPELLTGQARELLWLNPFYVLLEIVRAPMLGEAPGWTVWASAIGFSLVLWGLAWVLFARVRGRLAFWV